LNKVNEVKAEQAKCICTTQPYVFVGSWNGRISIYDVKKEFKLVKILKCKAAVRSICSLDASTIIVGENDGWFELIRVQQNLDLVEITSSKRIEAVGHVFTLQPTHAAYQVVVCSYTGIHFVKVECEDKTLRMCVMLQDLSYETEQFVNRILEYAENKFLAVSWDNNKFIFIDHEQEQITSILEHPQHLHKFNVRCWGLVKLPDFDAESNPFIVSRDNTGFVIINVKTLTAHQLQLSPITVNLYGHGDILRILRAGSD